MRQVEGNKSPEWEILCNCPKVKRMLMKSRQSRAESNECNTRTRGLFSGDPLCRKETKENCGRKEEKTSVYVERHRITTSKDAVETSATIIIKAIDEAHDPSGRDGTDFFSSSSSSCFMFTSPSFSFIVLCHGNGDDGIVFRHLYAALRGCFKNYVFP